MMNDSVNPNRIGDDSGASARMTTQSRPPGLAEKAAERTSLGHRFQRALPGGSNRRFPGLHPSPGGAASLSPFLNKRFTLPFLALLAVLTAGLLFLLPGGLLQAQSADPIEHPENSADPVLTFTAEDPEGRTIYWSLVEASLENAIDVDDNDSNTDAVDIQVADTADADHFMISPEGVLKFKMPPDFEMPKGVAPTDTLLLAMQNEYKLVVVASDDAPGAGTTAMPIKMAYHKVTVNVTDMDEEGSISFSAQQPQTGVALMATLKDQDATPDQITAAKWKWYHCPVTGTGCVLIPGQTMDMYSPDTTIVGMNLKAVATYKDASGSKEVKALAAHAVRRAPPNNADPEFPDDDGTDGADPQTREVNENSPPGTKVGEPVTAGDAGDILTYTLSGTGASMYTIDRGTGQIMVGRTMLDRDAADFEGTHEVMVRATDPFGNPDAGSEVEDNSDEVTVTITVKDVNEAPSITGGPTKVEWKENDKDSPGTEAINSPLSAPTYTATDVESTDNGDVCDERTDQGSNCTWSLEGDDASLFEISNAANGVNGQLTFKKIPNFEKPADANMDNVYMVTVVVTDPGMDTERAIGVGRLTAMRDVVITVDNAKEAGKIKFSSNQPKQGVEFVATLTDDDGPTTVTKWQWDRDAAGDATTATQDCRLSSLGWENAEGEGAKTDTYTPEADDLGKCLRVTPTYTDPLGDSTAIENLSAKAVVEDETNKAPQFKDANGKVITSTTRSVPENAVMEDLLTPLVGGPVTATDPNGTSTDPEGRLTYILGGTDARYFEITDVNSRTGQITVKEGTKLDYEAAKNSYMVTVTATDPSLASTTIDVTIMVTDVNEVPEFTAPKEGDVEVTVKENTRSLNIYSFRGTDPEGRPVYWSRDSSSADASSFTISDRGVLSLNASPDYETKDSYTVLVVASDDAPGAGITGEDPVQNSMKTVTVTVEDVEEQGTITTTPKNPHVGQSVAATLTDGDGEQSSITWEWTVSSGEPAGSGVNTDSYTPGEDDIGSTLRVKATYEEDDEDVEVGPTSAGRIVAAPVPANVAPVFDPSTANRRVDENARAGTRLGNAVKATDGNDSTLVYTVDDTANFSVNPSGQLSTAAMLNHEGTGNDAREVVVTATDPWGLSADLTYTVTVKDVNEAPMITTGPTRKEIDENETGDDLQVFDYGASDIDEDDDADLTWSIEGEDLAKFNIDDGTGVLAFKESPDYEMPADRNKDNVYKVTVVVSDDGSPELTDKRQVEVTVTDVEEEGEVTLSSVQPKVAIDLTASLEDPDGDAKDTAWQWYRSDAAACPAVLTAVGPALITALDNTNEWSEIPDAESDTYTPEVGTDKDEGKCLLALAKYNDRLGTSKAAAKQSNNVVIPNTDNRPPMFPKTEMGVREVNENAQHPANVDLDASTPALVPNEVDPDWVMATDPNSDTLTYTLGGTDAASFNIDADGQLSTKAKLDYEDKSSYMVTVTATDPDGLSATIDVTIMIMDMDESPKIYVGGLVVTGKGNVDYAENGTGMVATYSAAGPDAANATWSLSGADAGDLSISSAGVLTFMASPNYETKNTYMVTVEANDGTNTAMKAVTINVTNVDEDGTVSLSTQQPRVGTAITATLTDADGDVTGTAWQWAKATTMDGTYSNIAGATTSDSYTPVEGDVNMHLRATASYADGEGSSKTAMAVSENAVTAAAGDDLVDRYDPNNNGIEKTEVLKAINDYLFGEGDEAISKSAVLRLINLYLFGN